MAKMIRHYELRRELGRGGMATVYVAYDTNLEREVALKVLPAYFSHEPEFAARFEREAKTVSALEHGAIVPIYDYGEQDLVAFLVMRLMTGGSLGDRLNEGPSTPAAAAAIFSRIAGALDRAHRQGIVHRDLKPDNILFDEDGDAYLADFGIVKLAEGSTTFTQTGGTLGTPAYMSPEQARGLGPVDHRSDIYALGVIFYQMLTGRVPYEADTAMGQAMMHVLEPVPSLNEARPDLPASAQTIIDRAMAKDPDARFPSAGVLARAVQALAAEVARPAPPKAPQPTAATAPAREPAAPNPVTPPPARLPAPVAQTPATPESVPAASGPPAASQAPAAASPMARAPQQASVPAPGRPTATAPSGRKRRFGMGTMVAIGGGVLVLALIAAVVVGALVVSSRQRASNDDSVTATVAALAAANEAEAVTATEGPATEAPATEAPATRAEPSPTLVPTPASTAAPVPTATPVPLGGGQAQLVYASGNALFVINSNGSGEPTRLDAGGSYSDAVFSPDGRTLAFVSSESGESNIYTINADGSGRRQLTSEGGYYPEWSPDGSRIAFVTRRHETSPFKVDLYIMNANGSDETRITAGTEIGFSPTWSPDGSSFAFTVQSSADDATSTIVINLAVGDGSESIQVEVDNAQVPDWSPDGTQIAFTDSNEIHVMNVEGAGDQTLTTFPAALAIYDLEWSPDGRQLMFSVLSENGDGTRTNELYVINASGSGLLQLTDIGDLGLSDLAWSPDSNWIGYSVTVDGVSAAIYIVTADGSETIELRSDVDPYSPVAWRP